MIKIKYIHVLVDRYEGESRHNLELQLQKKIDKFLEEAQLEIQDLISIKHSGTSNRYTSEASVIITYKK